jgi:hypothetical protein
MNTAFNIIASITAIILGVYLIEPAQSDKLLGFLGGVSWTAGALWLRDVIVKTFYE